MKPTPEQSKAVDIAMTGKTFKMSAYAGAGKTSTLKLIGNALAPKKGMYLAFNKSIATEAASKFSRHIECKTFHSMAFRQTPRHITAKLSNPRLMPRQMASMFDLRDYQLPLDSDHTKSITCTGIDQAMILNRALSIFCRDTSDHVTHNMLMSAMPKWAHKQSCGDLAAGLVDKANAFWTMNIDRTSQFSITHDVYLKHWSSNSPVINADFILFDEAQDADPIMLDVLNKQRGKQIIFVGDRHQQIYGFRGAINAMSSLQMPEAKLTKSFRFGGGVADIANIILNKLLDEETPLVGNNMINSRVDTLGAADAYLVRTNAYAFDMAIQLIAKGRKPKLEVDTATLKKQIEDSIRLKNNESILDKNSDFFGFERWSQVEDYTSEYPLSNITQVVTLINNNDTDMLLDVISKVGKRTNTDCVVCTAHKSKGLEFSSVKLGGDFKYNKAPKDDGKLMSEDEARLFYVACTRAIQALDISEMSDLFNQLKCA